MAGNVGLLKHASNVSQCSFAIEQILCRAGFDDGVFQTLLMGPEQVERVIVDPRVKAVTLTGSENRERRGEHRCASDQEECARARRQRCIYRDAKRGI